MTGQSPQGVTEGVAQAMTGDLDFPVFDPAAPLPSGRLLIEASAGTGKTHTISTLAVRFVAEDDEVGAAGLCVVSFTEAATAELRSRIRQRMVEVADLVASDAPTTDEVVAGYRARPDAERAAIVARLRRATDEFDRATITTIHGFCSRVLAALGVGVGAVGPGGAEVAEVTNDLLLTAARPLVGPLPAAGERDAAGDPGAAGDPQSVEPSPGQSLPPVNPERFAKVVAELVRLPLATMDGVDSSRPPGGVAPGGQTPAGPPEDEAALLGQVGAVALEARRLVAARRRHGDTRAFDSLLTDVGALLDPASGATAATQAAARHALSGVKVLMVDEFQDTDGLQWAIFDNAFPLGECPMVLVGDPKQSIYRFRSAEVSVYLAARSSPGMEVVTLGTNYRSDEAVVVGIERLYTSSTGEAYALGSDVMGEPSVHFRPVAAHHGGRRLHGMDLDQSVELRVLNVPSAAKVPTGVRKAGIADDVAWEVNHLLRAADPRGDLADRLSTAVRIDDDTAPGGQRDLRPSDIAVLVNTNSEAMAIAHRLARAGLAAATATTSSVLDGAAAWQWRLLLTALARPAASGPARAAALGWFLGYPATRMADPDADLTSLHEVLASWAGVLGRGGPVAVLTEARRLGLADRLLVRSGGERRITDLEHIAEVLQAAVGSRPTGALEVLDTLDALAEGGDTESAVDQMARRIDRDDEAVQVLTVHRAKGLEFPIVLCPYLWASRRDQSVPHAAVPDGNGGVERRVWTPWLVKRTLSKEKQLGDFALPQPVARGGQQAGNRVQLEFMEEADRLIYVALTRAAAHLVVWWTSPANASGHKVNDQSLTRLLCHATGIPSNDLVATPDKADAFGDAAVAVRIIDPSEPTPVRAEVRGADDLDRARYTRSGYQPWRRWSYSRLSEHLGATHAAGGGLPPADASAPGSAPTPDPDEGRGGGADESLPASLPAAGPEVAAPGAPVTADPFGRLGGTRFGTMVHAVLERVDFTSPTLVDDLTVELGAAMAHWRDAALAPGVASGLAAALAVPLGKPLVASDTRLVALPPQHRLNELRFDFALGRTSTAELVAVLAADPAVSVPFGGWLAGLDRSLAIEGMLTGSIDLVGSFDAKQFWVADHKTNRLAAGYGPAELIDAMAVHDYPLQATLYLVALHRFLTQRLDGYDPTRHLTGAAYLFVRGMAAAGDGEGTGIYWFTPAPATIVAVSALLAAGERT